MVQTRYRFCVTLTLFILTTAECSLSIRLDGLAFLMSEPSVCVMRFWLLYSDRAIGYSNSSESI